MRLSSFALFATIFAFAVAARAADCDLQSETFDPSHLSLDAGTYKTDLRTCHMGGLNVTSLRSFEMSHQSYTWVVEHDSLVTGLVRRECLQDCAPFKAASDADHLASMYAGALMKTTQGPQPLQDGGVQRSQSKKLQMFVTADLCPSEKPMVRDVFERMMALGHAAVPVALSVSGVWLSHHPDDLEYLKSQEKNGRLQITWVNHTFTHPYDPALPLEHNFILKTGVNFAREILENEKLMLKLGLVPSVFVRLPGLISDQAHMTQLREWGLIPLGADAWLAKGQSPHNGSIILIHANGNEPKGIRLFDQLLDEHGWWIKIFNGLNHVFEKDDHDHP